MTTLYENIILHKSDGTTATTVITHIYSEHGHFIPAGWHIELGSGARVEDYVEVIDEGITHDIPASLPDVHIYDPEDDPEAEATVQDYEAVIDEVFGDTEEGGEDEGETDNDTDPNAD